MTLEEIKAAVNNGETVHWSNSSYTVVKDDLDQWFIVHNRWSCIGLTHADGVTMNGRPQDFYIG